MNDQRKDMEKIFETANKEFLKRNRGLFELEVSERTLCGALMLELSHVLKNSRYDNYYVDVEYNRNKNGKLKTILRECDDTFFKEVTINCDLIVHSRGENIKQDNLIAIEMKKSNAKSADKKDDKIRLECLTKDSFNDVWSFNGKVLPDHVCRYILGVYYEINFKRKKIKIEYYYKGKKYKERELDYDIDLSEIEKEKLEK